MDAPCPVDTDLLVIPFIKLLVNRTNRSFLFLLFSVNSCAVFNLVTNTGYSFHSFGNNPDKRFFTIITTGNNVKMLFKATFLFSLAATALALPATKKEKAAAAGTGASILSVQDYADFQVSDGVAGNALAEVQAKFPVSLTRLAWDASCQNQTPTLTSYTDR